MARTLAYLFGVNLFDPGQLSRKDADLERCQR